jgi:hypothetical protein
MQSVAGTYLERLPPELLNVVRNMHMHNQAQRLQPITSCVRMLCWQSYQGVRKPMLGGLAAHLERKKLRWAMVLNDKIKIRKRAIAKAYYLRHTKNVSVDEFNDFQKMIANCRMFGPRNVDELELMHHLPYMDHFLEFNVPKRQLTRWDEFMDTRRRL